MRLGIVLVLLVLAVPAAAHDFFIEPSSHRVEVGGSVTATLWVGSPEELDEIPRSNRRIVRFESHLGTTTAAIEGKHGQSPAGTVTFREAGIATLVYESTHSYVELEPAKFTAYLHEEGLDDIAELRERDGLEPIPGRESYARYVKSLITVGTPSPDAKGWDRRVGLPFEIEAVSDPRKVGRAAFRVTYEGKPRGNARVDLLQLDKQGKRVTSVAHARTDVDGFVTLTIPRNGRWIVATTHMRKAPPELQLEGEWESFWTSITFETGATAAKKSGGCAVTGGVGHFAFLVGLLGLLTARARRSRVRG